jgi:hypothetical protein
MNFPEFPRLQFTYGLSFSGGGLYPLLPPLPFVFEVANGAASSTTFETSFTARACSS